VTATFAYKARDAKGRLLEGTAEGESPLTVADELRSLGYVPIAVEARKVSALTRDFKIPGFGDRIPQKDLAVFARQFATMIDSGLSLVRALAVLQGQTENETLKGVVTEVRRDIEGGSSLSKALEAHPRAFNRLFVAMVSAGEAAGVLDDVLLRLATIIEKQVELRRKITSAMTYPAAVLGLVVLVMTAMVLFVVPTFAGLYDDLDGKLPLPTRILLAVSGFGTRFAPLLLLAAIGGAFGFVRWYRSDAGRARCDRLLLRLPIFGRLVHKTALTRFARTLSVLLRSGVPVLESLEITSRTVNNAVVTEAVLATQDAVAEGESMHEALARHPVFPPMVVQMLAVGEETGNVDTLLEKVSDFLDEEIETTVGTLTSLLEPLLIVVLGGSVGGMVVALYLPMFNIINLVK
jgi:type IV pilus assembly protein PilC